MSNEYVLAQDSLVERLSLMLEAASVKGIWWILEQPANSLMWEGPAMKATLARHSAELVRLDMGAFGGSSVKPTHLVGTAPCLQELARTCCVEDGAAPADRRAHRGAVRGRAEPETLLWQRVHRDSAKHLFSPSAFLA